MKQYDPLTLAQLGNRRASVRNAIRLDLSESTYGFHTGAGDFTYDSVVYKGAGKYLELRGLGGADDFSVTPIEVRLSSIPESPLTPGVLATFNDYTWHQQPATLFDVYLHPDTGAVIKVERVARRRIDEAPIKFMVGGEAVIVAKLMPYTLDNPMRGFLRYNNVDQRLIDPADAFFEFAALAGTQPISWGRNTQAASPTVRGGVGQR